MATANEEVMHSLHKMVAEGLAAGIKSDPTPAMLSAARQFLKDNCVIMVAENASALEAAAEAYSGETLPEAEEKILKMPSRQA